MLASTEEARTFESLKADLMRTSPGQFAAVCGSKLLGVFTSVDDALQAASDAFDADTLPAGAPILITEIAEQGQPAGDGHAATKAEVRADADQPARDRLSPRASKSSDFGRRSRPPGQTAEDAWTRREV